MSLITFHEIITGFTSATLNWRRGLSTYSEVLGDYVQICRDRLHTSPVFIDVKEYSYSEIWDLFHLKDC